MPIISRRPANGGGSPNGSNASSGAAGVARSARCSAPMLAGSAIQFADRRPLFGRHPGAADDDAEAAIVRRQLDHVAMLRGDDRRHRRSLGVGVLVLRSNRRRAVGDGSIAFFRAS